MIVLLALLGFFVWWALTDNHGVDACAALIDALTSVRQTLSSIVPFPWEVFRRSRLGPPTRRAGGPFCRNSRRGESAPVFVPQSAQLLTVGLAHEDVKSCGGTIAGEGADGGRWR